jgi:hypothetical protein
LNNKAGYFSSTWHMASKPPTPKGRSIVDGKDKKS